MKKLVSVLFLLSIACFGFMQIAATFSPQCCDGAINLLTESCEGDTYLYREDCFGAQGDLDPGDESGTSCEQCKAKWTNGSHDCSKCLDHSSVLAGWKCNDGGSTNWCGDYLTPTIRGAYYFGFNTFYCMTYNRRSSVSFYQVYKNGSHYCNFSPGGLDLVNGPGTYKMRAYGGGRYWPWSNSYTI
ncbi:hypothetical protein KAR48_11540 [bacterium]|nr:hypothetical protein [bacterium]